MNWHEYFTYDAETGNLIWKKRPLEHFFDAPACHRFWTRFAGKVAGCRLVSGRPPRISGIRILLPRHGQLRAHRVVWEMHYGPIPDGMAIDHINGNPLDNRLENLRLATKTQNNMNRGATKRNTSGYKGVSWNKKDGNWQAKIRIDGRNHHIGSFNDKEAAYLAYCDYAKKHHGEFHRL